MKKIIIYISLITGMFIANNTLYAQEKRFDHLIDFGLPKEAQYLDGQRQEAFAKEKPKLYVATKLNRANVYRLSDISLTVSAVLNDRTNGTTLEERKRYNDRFNAQYPDPNYSSEIRKIDNGKILIVHLYGYDGVYRYYLSGATLNYDKMFAISIRYEKKDAVKAKQLVDHILKNVKFK